MAKRKTKKINRSKTKIAIAQSILKVLDEMICNKCQPSNTSSFPGKIMTLFWDMDTCEKKTTKMKNSNWYKSKQYKLLKLPDLSELWYIATFGKFLGPSTMHFGFYSNKIPQKWTLLGLKLGQIHLNRVNVYRNISKSTRNFYTS